MRDNSHKGCGAVFTEHGDYRVQDDLGLVEVCGRAFNENVVCVEGDLAVVPWNKEQNK